MKVTKPLDRWYDDACGTAHALELLGERWSLLVVRELMFGPRRFGELREGLPGISANVLMQRLEGLEGARIVQRRRLGSPVNAQVYELTAWGYESEPILQAMGRFATRSPTHDPTLPFSVASLMMSFRTMIDPNRAAGVVARVGFRFPNDAFVVHVQDGKVTTVRGESADVDVAFASIDAATIASIVYGGRPLADAEAAGALTLSGGRSVAKRFATLFPLPPKVA